MDPSNLDKITMDSNKIIIYNFLIFLEEILKIISVIFCHFSFTKSQVCAAVNLLIARNTARRGEEAVSAAFANFANQGRPK